MPSALPLPTIENPGCVPCGKCVVCRDHLLQTLTFTSSTTGEVFTIREHLSCESTNIVYLLQCDTCKASQYIGQTKNTLRTRFYLHRTHIKHNTGTHVTRHFNLPNHTLQNMRCVALERVHHLSERARLAREDFWMKKMKTLFPFGLNSKEHD